MPSLVEIDPVVLEIFLNLINSFRFFLSSLRKGWITSFEETGRSFTQNFFVPSLVEPSLVVQEKKIFKFCQCNFAITLFCGQKIIKYAKVRRLITSCHLIQHIKNTLLTANINSSFDQNQAFNKNCKNNFFVRLKWRLEHQMVFQHYLSYLHRKHPRIMYKMWGRGDGGTVIVF